MYRSAGTIPGGKLSRGSPVHDVVQLISQERARIQDLVAALQVSIALAIRTDGMHWGMPTDGDLYLSEMTACMRGVNQLGFAGHS